MNKDTYQLKGSTYYVRLSSDMDMIIQFLEWGEEMKASLNLEDGFT